MVERNKDFSSISQKKRFRKSRQLVSHMRSYSGFPWPCMTSRLMQVVCGNCGSFVPLFSTEVLGDGVLDAWPCHWSSLHCISLSSLMTL